MIAKPPQYRSPLDAARTLAPRIRELAEQIDAERQLPPALVLAIAEAGLFKVALPASRGGGGADLPTVLEVIEEVARADGSTGWCVAQGINTFRQSSQLREDVAQELFFSDPIGVSAGSAGVRGTATVVPGGFRVNGRWHFASGCMHARSLHGGCTVLDGDQPRLREDGMPEERIVYFPLDACEIVDVWTVSGLRGTGSHDIVAADLFVPQERTFLRNVIRTNVPAPVNAIPGFDLAACNFAAVGLGAARAAIDALVELAVVKVPRRGGGVLREHAMVQTQVAQAEATLSAGRAFLFQMVHEVWDTVTGGGGMMPAQRGRLRLAAAHAAQSCARAADIVRDAAGTTAIFVTNPLERYLRDVHVVATHIQLQPSNYEAVGRLMLGLESNSPMF